MDWPDEEVLSDHDQDGGDDVFEAMLQQILKLQPHVWCTYSRTLLTNIKITLEMKRLQVAPVLFAKLWIFSLKGGAMFLGW